MVTAARSNLYADAFNEAVFEKPGKYLTRALVYFDNKGIDGLVNGLAAAVGGGSGRLRRTQTGFVRSYALSMLGGALLVAVRVPRSAGSGDGMTDAETFPYLTVLTALPLVGALVVALLPRSRAATLAKQVALVWSLVVLGLGRRHVARVQRRRRAVPAPRVVPVDPDLGRALHASPSTASRW